MKRHLLNTARKIKKRATYVAMALVCVTCGCGKKNAPPPVAATDKTQPSVASPAIEVPPSSVPGKLQVASPATQPSITDQSAKKPMQFGEAFGLENLINRIPTNEFTFSEEGGWDKFTMPKVQKWIQENLAGKRERVNVCMLQCNVVQEDAATKPDEWTVDLQVAGIHANYFGMANRILPIDRQDQTDHSPSIETWGKASFVFKCTEAEARKWDVLSKKSLPSVTVEGDIVGIGFQPRAAIIHSPGHYNLFFIGYDTFVQLENITMTPSKDTEQSALFAPEFVMAQSGRLRESDESITEIRRLGSTGDYQLVFMKYWKSRYQDANGDTSSRFMTNLLTFSLIPSLDDEKIKVTPCDDPPTESQIAEAKATVAWPK